MEWFTIHYRNESGRVCKEVVSAKDADGAQEQFVDYFENDVKLPVPVIISIVGE